jgi:BirA family biotin operon repressor/biotin-[acetyl-CoA-carboxylase] ligase
VSRADAPQRDVSALGNPRLHLRRTDSTNARARELALAGAPHGTLVTAAEQTAGRGRQGRRWEAPAGSSVLMSLLLRSPQPLLPLIAAVAVCDVVGDRALIKWPNDVVIASGGGLAKLAGILVESRPQEGWAVLGIGLNVAVRLDQLPDELQPGARDPAAGRRPLAAATLGGVPEDVEPVLQRLLAALARRLQDPTETVLESWRSRDGLRGRAISWSGGSGLAQGVDGLGRLVVELPAGGRTALTAGEVHLESIA